MRSIRHWTPRYVMNRVSLAVQQRLHPDWPWITADMIRILDTWLRKTDCGLEWGSGRSTAWFAKRVDRLTTVEHNPAWAEIVRAMLDEAQLTNVRQLLETETNSYIDAAPEIARGTLDFVLVDGLWDARPHCALRAITLLKAGGIVIVDNVNSALPSNSRSPGNMTSDNHHWREFGHQVKHWRHIWTTNGVSDTAFWVKP